MQYVRGWSLQYQPKKQPLTHRRSQLQEMHREDITVPVLGCKKHPRLLPGAADSSGLLQVRREWTHCTTGKINRRPCEVCCLLNNVLGRRRLIQSSNYCTFLLNHVDTSDTSKKQLLSKSRVTNEHCEQGWRGPGGISISPVRSKKLRVE